MGVELPKAFLPLGGTALFLHALRTLRRVAAVSDIVLVTAPDQFARATDVLSHEPGSEGVELVAGGAERQDSVAAGLAAVPQAELILVHDAARPFVTEKCIAACIEAAALHGAAIAALPCHDTVKEVDGAGRIIRTLPRSALWLAQTPQVCRADWLRDVFSRAAADDAVATDEAGLLERYGYPVRVVAGDAVNRKITTIEDLGWAEWYLARRCQPDTA